MRPALRIFAGHTLKGNVWTTVDHLLQLTGHAGTPWQLAEVYGLDFRQFLLDEIETPVLVDHEDSRRTFHQGKICAHLADRSGAPNRNGVPFIDTGVDDTVPRSR